MFSSSLHKSTCNKINASLRALFELNNLKTNCWLKKQFQLDIMVWKRAVFAVFLFRCRALCRRTHREHWIPFNTVLFTTSDQIFFITFLAQKKITKKNSWEKCAENGRKLSQNFDKWRDFNTEKYLDFLNLTMGGESVRNAPDLPQTCDRHMQSVQVRNKWVFRAIGCISEIRNQRKASPNKSFLKGSDNEDLKWLQIHLSWF